MLEFGILDLAVALLIGFAIGYGAREYVSRRRRAAEWRRQQTEGKF
jgi:hypothetical protein